MLSHASAPQRCGGPHLLATNSRRPMGIWALVAPQRLLRLRRPFQQAAMSTPSVSPSVAPWREAFLSHVELLQPPAFVLSTLHAVGQASVVPRARTVIFRGMWAGLPSNPKNPVEPNAAVYQTHLPTICTDARMEKALEVMGGTAPVGQSGGGNPIEAVFWVPAVQTQWRLRGRAFVVGPDIESEAGAMVRDALRPHMHPTGAAGSWSWSRELTAHFGGLSPLMRGSFRNPPPGKPLAQEPAPQDGLRLGQAVEDVDDTIARTNFRVVVIVPDEVDQVDLTDPERGRRWNYKLERDGTWKATELWP